MDELGGDRRRERDAHPRQAVGHEHRVRLVGGEHARDPQLVQPDVGDQDVARPERLADLPQHPRRLHGEGVVVLGGLEAPEHDVVEPRRRRRVSDLAERVGQPGEDDGEVADEVDRGDEVLVDLGREGVDAHDPLVALRVPVRGRVLDEVVADRDHHVGLLEARQRVVARLHADGAERVRVLVVEHPLAHERLGDADAGRAGERAQGGRRAGAGDAVAGQHDRPVGAADELDRGQQLLAAGLGVAEGVAHGERSGVDARRHHVLGQLDVRRPGLLRLGDLERLAHDLRDHPRRVQAGVELRDRPQHVDDVDVLVRLLVHPLQVGLAGERDHRRAVEQRIGDSGHEVRRAGPERAQADPGVAGQAAVHVGHVRTALLVADRHERDRRRVERLVEIQRLLARDAEYVLDALGLEAFHEQIRRLALAHPNSLPHHGSWLP